MLVDLLDIDSIGSPRTCDTYTAPRSPDHPTTTHTSSSHPPQPHHLLRGHCHHLPLLSTHIPPSSSHSLRYSSSSPHGGAKARASGRGSSSSSSGGSGPLIDRRASRAGDYPRAYAAAGDGRSNGGGGGGGGGGGSSSTGSSVRDRALKRWQARAPSLSCGPPPREMACYT